MKAIISSYVDHMVQGVYTCNERLIIYLNKSMIHVWSGKKEKKKPLVQYSGIIQTLETFFLFILAAGE